MSSRKETTQLLKKLRSEGAVITMARNGHWKVFNPATNQSIQIAQTPSDFRTIRNERLRLRRIGLMLGNDQ